MAIMQLYPHRRALSDRRQPRQHHHDRNAAGQILVNGDVPSGANRSPTPPKSCVRRERRRHDLARQRSAARRQALPPAISCSAATATTPSTAATATTPSTAATATTRSSAVKAPTRRSSAPATTRSSGIRATAMTWSRAASRLRHARLQRQRQLAGETFSIDRPTAPGRRSPVPRQRHHGSHQCRAHPVRGSGPDADNITINDLTGTDVKQVAIDLGAGPTATAMVRRTRFPSTRPTANAITVTDNNGVVTVSGLASTVTISNFEAGTDHLVINGQTVTVTDGQTVTVAAANSNNTGGTSTASDGSHAASLALLGQHMASSFVAAGDGHGATPIADQPSSQQPLLTQPHA